MKIDVSSNPEMDEGWQAVVVDAGTAWYKCGFGGDDYPQFEIPTLTGRPRRMGCQLYAQVGVSYKDIYVGNEARAKRDILNLTSPIQRGVVVNWKDMEEVNILQVTFHFCLYYLDQIGMESHLRQMPSRVS